MQAATNNIQFASFFPEGKQTWSIFYKVVVYFMNSQGSIYNSQEKSVNCEQISHQKPWPGDIEPNQQQWYTL